MGTAGYQSNAKTGCQNIGGILAPVSNSDENACVASTFDIVLLFRFSVMIGSSRSWIGIERIPSCNTNGPNCWFTINNNQPVRRSY